MENNIDFTDFSKEITDSLPQLPWSIPKVANPDIHMIILYRTLSLVSIFIRKKRKRGETSDKNVYSPLTLIQLE